MGNPTLILTATLAAVAVVASLAGLFSIIRHRRKAKTKAPEAAKAASKEERKPLPYRRVEALLTPSERALYSALRPAAVVQGADIFAKVRLDDVVEVRKGAPDRQGLCARLAACRVGFLLCDREHLTPLLALEIDGDRARRTRKEDTKLLNETLAAVGLPLAHVTASTSYDPEVIAGLVHDEIAGAASPAEPAAESAEPAADSAEETESPAVRRNQRGWQAPVTVPWLNLIGEGEAAEAPDGAAVEAGPAEGSEPAEAGEAAAEPPVAATEPDAAFAADADVEAPPEDSEPHVAFAADDDVEAPPEDSEPHVAFAADDDVEAPPEDSEPHVAFAADDDVEAPPEDSELDASVEADAGAEAPAEEAPAVAPAEEEAPEGEGAGAEPAPAEASEPVEGPGEPRCPACGGTLVEMQDVETGVIVLACSRYPECPHVQAR